MVKHNFKNLKVWQMGMEMIKEVYRLSYQFPKEEQYGLVTQFKKSVISIPSNIAEGTGRNSDKDFSRFLHISLGSSFELETQMIASEQLGFISANENEQIAQMNAEVQKMLMGLILKVGQNIK